MFGLELYPIFISITRMLNKT